MEIIPTCLELHVKYNWGAITQLDHSRIHCFLLASEKLEIHIHVKVLVVPQSNSYSKTHSSLLPYMAPMVGRTVNALYPIAPPPPY